MTGKERIALAMTLDTPDRVPLMCQLSMGHYFLQSPETPFAIWFTSEGFARALVALARRYHFDGILVNLPGRDPAITEWIAERKASGDHEAVKFLDGSRVIMPCDDNPRYEPAAGKSPKPALDGIDPDQLFYVEPWDITGISHPYCWGFDGQAAALDDFFPDYHDDTLKAVRRLAGGDLSIHSEIFSPFSQFMELLSLKEGLMALLTEPDKVHACLSRLTEGAICLGCRQAGLKVDAVLISSAYAGGAFLSRELYQAFVLPYERRLISAIKARHDITVYTHTCGTIGDRLDLMLATGTNGIDTLDPPPLGNVKLADAVECLQGKAFIKGNIDSVNTLLKGSREQVLQDALERLRIAAPGGGYILSSACSVAPHVPPDNLLCLSEAITEFMP